MRVSHDPEKGLIFLQLENDAALNEKLDEWRSFPRVRLEERIEEGSEVTATLASQARRVSLPCRVKQVFRSGQNHWGIMLEVLDWAEAGPVPSPAAGEQGKAVVGRRLRGRPHLKNTPEGEAVAASETRGVSPTFELKQMNPRRRRCSRLRPVDPSARSSCAIRILRSSLGS